MGTKEARMRIVSGRVKMNGIEQRDIKQKVDRFCSVEMDGEEMQAAEKKIYIMLHKPAGILSATADAVHRTVLDLIEDPDKSHLHLVGRLDRATTGIILLTNDGVWSKRLMEPGRRVEKIYRVETLEPIGEGVPEAFARGFYFHTEDITTLPVKMDLLGERTARLILHEGRYHQIKRMFHRVGNRVKALHRESIGSYHLGNLAPGEWRYLNHDEIEC